MDITPLVPQGRLLITRYGDGGFVVGEVPYKGNILLLPDRVLPWEATSFADIVSASLEPLFTGETPEIMLIGSGGRFVPLAPGLREFIRGKGVSPDAMDTGAACRTYNVLVTEGRQVAAALIAV